MNGGRKKALQTVLLGAALAGIMIAAWRPPLGDYTHIRNVDNPGPAIWELAHGHLARLSDAQPLMGAASLILRAPLAAIGDALGGIRLEYWLGAFGCLTVLAVLALALGAEARRRNGPLVALVVVVLILLNPTTTQSISVGHAEEILLAALATAAVWATVAGRAISGGALAGTAIGTLPFGLASLIACAMATRAWRGPVVVTAVLVGALLTLPLPLTAPQTYRDRSRELAQYRRVYPQSLWWWTADARTLQVDTGGAQPEPRTVRLMPGGLDRGSGLLVGAALTLAAAALILVRSRGRPLGYNALALLAFFFLLRSACDPLNLEYYAAPGIVALVAWEVLARSRLPVASVVAVGVDIVVFRSLNGHDTVQAIVYALGFIGLGAYLLAVARSARQPSLHG